MFIYRQSNSFSTKNLKTFRDNYLERGGQATEHSGPKMTIWGQEPSTLALEGMGPQRTNQICLKYGTTAYKHSTVCVHPTSQ